MRRAQELVEPTIKPKDLKPGMEVIRPGRNFVGAPKCVWRIISVDKRSKINGIRVRPFWDVHYQSDESTTTDVYPFHSEDRFALAPYPFYIYPGNNNAEG